MSLENVTWFEMEQLAGIDIFVVSRPLLLHIDLFKFLFYIFGPKNQSMKSAII